MPLMTRIPNIRSWQALLILVCLTCVLRAQQTSVLVPLPNPATMVLRSPTTVKHLALTEKQMPALDALLAPLEIAACRR